MKNPLIELLPQMSRQELALLAKEFGVPVRLTKAGMIERLTVAMEPKGFDRQARDNTRAYARPLYNPAGHLQGRDLTSRRARNRFERRHTVTHVQPNSKHPMRPAVIVLTTSLRKRNAIGERVIVRNRFLPGSMVPATREAMGDWR